MSEFNHDDRKWIKKRILWLEGKIATNHNNGMYKGELATMRKIYAHITDEE